MNVLVIDGQGGGLGRQLVAALSAQCPDIRLVAVGTCGTNSSFCRVRVLKICMVNSPFCSKQKPQNKTPPERCTQHSSEGGFKIKIAVPLLFVAQSR